MGDAGGHFFRRIGMGGVGRTGRRDFRQDIFHKRLEALMQLDFRRSGVAGLFQPQIHIMIQLLQERRLPVAFIDPVAVQQDDFFHA